MVSTNVLNVNGECTEEEKCMKLLKTVNEKCLESRCTSRKGGESTGISSRTDRRAGRRTLGKL